MPETTFQESRAAAAAVTADSSVVAAHELKSSEPSHSHQEQPREAESCPTPAPPPPPPLAAALSKNAQKRLKRQLEWEAGEEDRKKRRKEKRQEKRQRLRGELQTARAEAEAAGLPRPRGPVPPRWRANGSLERVAVVVDCGFDSYMENPAITSLASQITRVYSDNRVAKLRTHLWVSGWGGRLRERFEGPMKGTHRFWKGIRFEEGGFLQVARQARGVLEGEQGGEDAEILRPKEDQLALRLEDGQHVTEMEKSEPNVVYLSSESPYVLDRLEAGTCYVLGGLVDKGKEKGLCYRLATEAGVRTAKLPIGQYLEMDSRRVLATNHVFEIMLRWLELGDWGEAFIAVMPKRKGGKLRGEGASSEGGGDGQVQDDVHGGGADELDAEVEMAKALEADDGHEEGYGNAPTAEDGRK